jgi:D-alanyl-lipoteichoic acid acyltransferase DltB (MBOAT superfamily)
MLFDSIPFAIFFIVFFFLYWGIFNRNLKLQNILILTGSYVFYCFYDWRFGFLILFYSIFAYFLGLFIYRNPNPETKSKLLKAGVLFYVASLLYFKYTNFFITSLDSIFRVSHAGLSIHTLNILLPLGISFFSFRILSYLFDIKNGKFKPTEDWIVFFSYVSFFPSLVAGPIDRPKLLIPQLENERKFDYYQAVDGLRQILWGLFKKVVIANSVAPIVDYAFGTKNLHGFVLISGAFFYAIQIYADFSGYSDMALGVAKLIGFNITRNFNNPYFAQNIADFWRRWHISLTSWLTDYIFIPVSIQLRDYGTWGSIMAIIITFLVSGLWHGANWTFVVWGFLHGCYFIPLILKGKMNKKKDFAADKILPSLSEAINIAGTFLLVMFTLVLFRAESLSMAFKYYKNILEIQPYNGLFLHLPILVFVILMFVIEWVQRNKQHALEIQSIKNVNIRWSIYLTLFFITSYFMMTATLPNTGFIYIKF